MACGDVLSLEDLQTAKKHQIFEAEVITGKAGGVAGGAPIDFATNQVTGQTQKTLPAVLRDAGFRPASFTFETGGALVVGDSDVGVLWPVSSGGDGGYYLWKGAYPKVVPAASSPATTGGVSDSGWLPLGDITLRGELASTEGASRIGTSSGDTVQGVIDDVSSSVVYLDSYSSLVVSGDWTSALQAALDTGLPLVPNPTVTYTVSGIVQSKGNRIIGPLNINPTRSELAHLGAFTVNKNDIGEFERNLKMMYCIRAYDLIELLYIKSMGFNAITHGGDLYTEKPGMTPAELKVALGLMLDNCQTAGLKVNMTTGWELANDVMAVDYVTTFSPHPAVFGFSVFDEPTFHGISVAQQTTRLNLLRAITEKNLNCVDVVRNYVDYRNGYNPFAHGYDIMFVDSYCHTVSGATLQENISTDLSNMRTDVGIATAYCTDSKIVPVCGLFKHTGFTTSFDQIKATAEKLVRCAGGDFGVWAWDAVEAGLTGNMRNSSDLRGLAKSFCEMVVNGERLPKAHLVGGTSFNPSGIPPVASANGVSLVKKQQDVITFIGSNAALGSLRNGIEGEFTSTQVSGVLSGLLLKSQFPVAITNISMLPNLTVDFELIDITASQSGTLSFSYTEDDGATASPSALDVAFSFAPPSAPAMAKSLYLGPGEYRRNNKLIISASVNAPAVDSYRLLLHGFIVTSEW